MFVYGVSDSSMQCSKAGELMEGFHCDSRGLLLKQSLDIIEKGKDHQAKE